MEMEATLVMDVTTVVDEHGAPSQEPGDQRDSCKDEQDGEIRAWLESCDVEEQGRCLFLSGKRQVLAPSLPVFWLSRLTQRLWAL
jgi:hypothetical protein